MTKKYNSGICTDGSVIANVYTCTATLTQCAFTFLGSCISDSSADYNTELQNGLGYICVFRLLLVDMFT